MRMKKMLCVLLVLIIILSLGACSQIEEPDPTTENPNQTASDLTQPTERKLIFKEFAIPVIEPFQYVHEEIAGVDRSYTETCFNFDIIDMYAALQNSSFFNSSNGHNLKMMTGEDAMFYHSDFPMYDFYNSVYCELGGSDKSPDVTISLDSIWQTAYFTTPNGIRLTMTYNPDAEGYIGMIQDYPYEVLATIIGEEFANFVVYAKDSDGLDYIYEESILPTDLSENADAGNGGYRFCRTFNENQVIYEIFFYENTALGDQQLIGRPIVESTYESLPYKINSMVGEGFGGYDISDISHFGDKIFTTYNADLPVLASSIRHFKTVDGNQALYDVGFTLEQPDTWNIIDYIASYTISENEIVDVDLTGYFSLEHDDVEFEHPEQHFDALIQILNNLIPNSTITCIKEVDRTVRTYQIDYAYLGIERSETFTIYISSDAVSTQFDMEDFPSYPHEHNHQH
ncbi:MAG: hypothetical protein IJ419_13670 [Agathobacter sp.]|nr:hypothetical protein [Agathobacter sp.]